MKILSSSNNPIILLGNSIVYLLYLTDVNQQDNYTMTSLYFNLPERFSVFFSLVQIRAISF